MPSNNFFGKAGLNAFRCFLSVCISFSVASKAHADRLGSVSFFPNLYLVDTKVGPVRAILSVTQDEGSGSAAVEIDSPLMYFNAFQKPDPEVDMPCAYGIPSEIAGLTSTYTFNFGNSVQCPVEQGYYGFFYSARVTNNSGTYPSSSSFQSMAPRIQRVILIPDRADSDTGSLVFADPNNVTSTSAMVAKSSLRFHEFPTKTSIWDDKQQTTNNLQAVPEKNMIVGTLLAVGLWGGLFRGKKMKADKPKPQANYVSGLK